MWCDPPSFFSTTSCPWGCVKQMCFHFMFILRQILLIKWCGTGKMRCRGSSKGWRQRGPGILTGRPCHPSWGSRSRAEGANREGVFCGVADQEGACPERNETHQGNLCMTQITDWGSSWSVAIFMSPQENCRWQRKVLSPNSKNGLFLPSQELSLLHKEEKGKPEAFPAKALLYQSSKSIISANCLSRCLDPLSSQHSCLLSCTQAICSG